MRKIRIIMAALAAALPALTSSGQSLKEVEGAYLEQLEPRDSILIADQLRYGFSLGDVEDGTQLMLPDWSKAFGDTLVIARNWQIDTVKVTGPGKKSASPARYDIKCDIVIAPFETGHYVLPRIATRRVMPDGMVDTLLFEPFEMDVTTIQIDTSTFVIHDIKDQIRYPLTAREVLPYVAGFLLLAALVAFLTVLIVRHRRKARGRDVHKDPPYIVALRQLDRYRGDKFWAPDKQKVFYSGITDTLREYIAGTLDVDAREMTTAEIFDALKDCDRITPDLYAETKDLFEVADFVKFAKHVVDDEDNAKALPKAVRFVTSTYQVALEDETAGTGTDKKEAE